MFGFPDISRHFPSKSILFSRHKVKNYIVFPDKIYKNYIFYPKIYLSTLVIFMIDTTKTQNQVGYLVGHSNKKWMKSVIFLEISCCIIGIYTSEMPGNALN